MEGGQAAAPETAPDETAPLTWGVDAATRWLAWATLGFVGLGILLRGARYLLNFPLWCDETMIAANFLDRGYADLLRPLDHRQVAPLLWLAVELTSVKLLGFSEWSLRLFPTLCALASVVLFRHVAGRLFSGVPLLLAVAIFAVSGWPLRYSAEVKPYASDLFVALGVLALAIEWWRAEANQRNRWLWALAAVGPIAVGLSLPALFVLGTVGLVLALPVLQSRQRGAITALGVYGLGVVATFVLLLPFYKTAPQDHDYFHNAWAPAFPPLGNPLKLVAWFLDVNTGFLFAYPEGGAHGLSTPTFLAFLIGAVVLWKRGLRIPAWLCVGPFGLALVAAAIHRYPYGVSARTSQYAAPLICLVAGLGVARMLLAVPQAKRLASVQLVVFSLALLGVCRLGYDLSHPYKTLSDQRARAFAQWFWTELSRDGELVCLAGDLGVVTDERNWTRGASHTYLCYQRIYSPRHAQKRPPKLDRVAISRPLRCVVFNEYPEDKPKFVAWMNAMNQKYDFYRRANYNVSTLEKKPGATQNQVYLVYEFTPKAAPAVAAGESAPRR